MIFTGYTGESIIQGHNIVGMTDGNGRHPETFNDGLFCVSGIRTGTPKVRDLLDGGVVVSGRFAGEKLSNKNPKWSDRAVVNSPALSFDGKRVAFACASTYHVKGMKPERSVLTTSHIYTMGIDGSDLRQLTDRDYWNDYQPCWLPNGRIVFVSERLNRQERCGGRRPGGNLFSMKTDGSDLYPISWHETNELYPSIVNNGMMVYTRWDYVDRGFSAAHPVDALGNVRTTGRTAELVWGVTRTNGRLPR